MTHYVVNTKKQQQAMLKEIGYDSFFELFQQTGITDCLHESLAIPKGITEFEAYDQMKSLADENTVFKSIFRGAGAYRHYIPSVVKHITSREEFVSAYTPYQAEISQGILQAIYEYQTMICELTGMEVSNASVYDGATAAAEAINMCIDSKKRKVILSNMINPQIMTTIQTYYQFSDLELIYVNDIDGVIDIDQLNDLIDENVACIVLQTPNFEGCIEDIALIRKTIKEVKMVTIVNPISLGLLEAPGALGSDIVVGEGQPLGLPLSFGGPYLGFMATSDQLVRRLPGRIVGETIDINGKRAFTLTLQAREQHIRREKASSSICTNQALCAFTSAVYMSALGPKGLAEVANACFQLAHYLEEQLNTLGFRSTHRSDFFHEFVTDTPIKPDVLLTHLEKHGILGGYQLADNRLLWCATEVNSKDEIDQLIKIIKEVR